MEAAYPQAAYVAQEGRGASRTAAETDALAALSRFFMSEVSATTHSGASWSSGGGGGARLDTDTFIRSNTKLFAVRYAAPWYDPRAKEYLTVAYLNREEAWAVFAPRVRREADGFRALWRLAESETAPLKTLFAYRALQRYVSRPAYSGTMSFGEALNPDGMNALVRDIREQGAQLAAKTNEARNMASVFIDCPKDFESNIGGTLTKLLSGAGLVIAKTKNAAQAVCAVTVDEGFQRREGTGDFYAPRISVVLGDKTGGPLFSYSAAPGRQAAITPDVAKRRAYAALAAALERNFIEEFDRTFETNRPAE